MIKSSAREQSLPLATEGYVLGVRERFVQVTRLADGTSEPANIKIEDIAKVVFSVQHSAIRMTVKSIGGINNSVRSEDTSLSISQKSVRIGVSSKRLSLSLSKN